MEIEKAQQILFNSLRGYVEDSAGAESDEAKEIDVAWELANAKMSEDAFDVGLVASVMSYERFDDIRKWVSEGTMMAHDTIANWAKEFSKKYNSIQDWGDDEELRNAGFKSSGCWEDAIIEFVDNKIGK